jgi:anthranilate phosphoribosyltransferase
VWVVCGRDGLDEVSPFVATTVTELRNGIIREFEVTPEDFGLPRSPAGAIAGGDGAFNAAQLEAILSNEPHPARDAVLLNAAATLVVVENIPYKTATEKARGILESGAAKRKLEQWRAVAQRQKQQ